MTARPEDQPLALDDGAAERTGKPRGAEADDGKQGGATQGGRPAAGMGGGGAGDNAQRGAKSGTESERDAPGMSTGKKADDTK